MEEYRFIQEVEQEDKALSFDPDRLNTVWKKFLPWIILLFIIALFVSYLTIRYTKPLYESSSVLKLNIKRDASILGLSEYDEEQSYNSLSSEMELLKSTLFFNRIIDAVGMDVSIYTIGKILLDERYNNPPFTIDYQIKDDFAFDAPFRVDILNTREFRLSSTIAGASHESVYGFGNKVNTTHADFVIELTEHYIHGSQDNEFYFFLNSRKNLLEYIAENFSVEPLNLNANTIQISFKDYNKFKARDLVNAIDTIYLRYTQDEKNRANSQKIRFLNQQLEATEKQLSDFENYFESFIIQNKSVDLTDNLSETINYLNALDSQRFSIEIKISRLSGLMQELVAGEPINLGLSDYKIIPEPIIDDIDELNHLIESRESVLISHNKNTQVYRKWSDEIDGLHNRIKDFLIEYESELQNRLEEIDAERSRLEKEFIELPSKNTDYTKSQRRYTLYEEFYLSLMQKKAEFQLAMAGTVTDFKILSTGTLPTDPLKPQKYLIFGISIVAWLLISFFSLGIGYVSFNKITGISELERITELPILGAIPYFNTEKLLISKIVIQLHSNSAVSEAFRSIRTNMQFILPEQSGIITSISSTVSGEGKTFMGLNLSTVFALSGKKVILMDMDLRKPKLHKIFDRISLEKGISTLLIGKDELGDCIVPSDIENLDLLPSGPIPPNPSELIMSEKADMLFASLKRKYDMIFMDTPPVGIVTDGVLVMKKADIQLYVLRADYSRRNFVDYLTKLNDIHSFRHLYIIVNAVKGSRGIHYGYGYGSGYYHEKKKNWISRLVRR